MCKMVWNAKSLPPGGRCPEGADEGWRAVSTRRKSDRCITRQVTARIPHQSKIVSVEPIFASFPPGEAKGAPAPMQVTTNIV